jgi:hypothetical protein
VIQSQVSSRDTAKATADAVSLETRTVRHHRRKAGQDDEQLGGISKAEDYERQAGERIGNVIEKNS